MMQNGDINTHGYFGVSENGGITMQHRGFSWGHGDQAVDLKQFAALEALANSRFWSFKTWHLGVQIMVSCRFSLNQSVERDSDLDSDLYGFVSKVLEPPGSSCFSSLFPIQELLKMVGYSVSPPFSDTRMCKNTHTHFWCWRLCDRVPTPGFFMSFFGIFWWLRVFLINNTRFQNPILRYWEKAEGIAMNQFSWGFSQLICGINSQTKIERSVSRYLQGAFFCGRSFGDNPTPPQFWVVQLGQHRYALCSWFFLTERLKADQTLLSYNRWLQRQEFQAIHDRISWLNPLYIHIYIYILNTYHYYIHISKCIDHSQSFQKTHVFHQKNGRRPGGQNGAWNQHGDLADAADRGRGSPEKMWDFVHQKVGFWA